MSITDYRILGRSGLRVTPLALGTMMLGAAGNPDHDESIRIIHQALDAGINFVDCADIYSRGESETIVGKALRGGRREKVVLATKAYRPMSDDPNHQGGSRRWIYQAVDDSLRRLQTDWIDLFQLHRLDHHTDLDETLGALSDLVAAGKIRSIGTSTFPAEWLVEAQWVAERRGRERPVSEQPPYSLLAREIEKDVLPTAQRYGLGILTYSPLNGGWLTGRGRAIAESRRRAQFPHRYDLSLPVNQRKYEAVEKLQTLADEIGISLIHLAIAFVIRHPAVTAAIIGPRTVEQLESQLGAADVVLSDEVLDRIDEIVAPGTTINPADRGYDNPALSPAARRRPAGGKR